MAEPFTYTTADPFAGLDLRPIGWCCLKCRDLCRMDWCPACGAGPILTWRRRLNPMSDPLFDHPGWSCTVCGARGTAVSLAMAVVRQRRAA